MLDALKKTTTRIVAEKVNDMLSGAITETGSFNVCIVRELAECVGRDWYSTELDSFLSKLHQTPWSKFRPEERKAIVEAVRELTGNAI